jgi:DNA modification methylase
MASITEFGWTNPVLIDEKTIIIAGHARYEAARRLGMEKVPCIELSGLTEVQKRAYRIADNRLPLNAGWDDQLLSLELGELQDMEFDLGLIGFNQDELNALLANNEATEGLTDPDEIPPTPEVSINRPGDLWILGRQRLLCGDSTKAEDVDKLMNGQTADMVFTDPPYNINYKGRGRNTSNTIRNDNVTPKEFQQFLSEVFANYARHTKSGAALYVFHASRTQKDFEQALQSNGYEIKAQIIWNKPIASLGWSDYQWKHEPMFYAGKKGEKIRFYGDRTHKTVWDFQKTEQQLLDWAKQQKKLESDGKTTIWSMRRDNVMEYLHPTQKPVELIVFAVVNSSKTEDIVLDLFGGSGATLIACERSKRICHTMELDPKYCDVIIERWQNFTGLMAVSDGDNRTWAEVKTERSRPN